MRVRIMPYLPQLGRGSLEIAVILDDQDRREPRYMALAVGEDSFVAVEEGMITPRPFTVSLERAQELMDALWICGLRPSEGSGSAGAMAAARENLKDLRKQVDYDHQLVQRLLDLLTSSRRGDNG